MTLYTGLLKTATRLIKKFGGPFTYTEVVKGNYDPATRSQTGSATPRTVTGVFLGPGKTFIDGTIIPRGDARFLLVPGVVSPRPGDLIWSNGIQYFVQDVQTVDPSGAKKILYILDLKAA
jgi:hypothetical protein